jgi:hypothetical protein
MRFGSETAPGDCQVCRLVTENKLLVISFREKTSWRPPRETFIA